jgi:hypothetical protein
MKVSSKDLYKALRTPLAPEMKAAGFSTIKEGRLGWRRGSTSLFFQCDKWGWTEDWGSSFTLEFHLDSVDEPTPKKARFERLGYLLEGFPELDDLRLRKNEIISRLPGTIGNRIVTRDYEGAEIVVIGEKVNPEPLIYGKDIWLNYHTPSDAHDWGEYFLSNLLRFVSIFENDERSAQGLARRRFNAAMGRVQAEKSFELKAIILEDYKAKESDPFFRSAADYWIACVHERTPAQVQLGG